jgi:hypothetical protein
MYRISAMLLDATLQILDLQSVAGPLERWAGCIESDLYEASALRAGI